MLKLLCRGWRPPTTSPSRLSGRAVHGHGVRELFANLPDRLDHAQRHRARRAGGLFLSCPRRRCRRQHERLLGRRDRDRPCRGGHHAAHCTQAASTAAAVSISQVNLSWTASSDAVGVTNYLIERCQGAGCTNFTQVASTAAAAFSDVALLAATSYCTGYGRRMPPATWAPTPRLPRRARWPWPTPPRRRPPALHRPRRAVSTTQINLAWSASSDNVGVTGYRIERCQGAGCANFAQIATSATLAFSNTGLAASTSYSYRVAQAMPPGI